MKHIKIIAVAFASMLALASCNTDQEGATYTPTSETVSLPTTEQSYTTDQEEFSVPVRFTRANTKSEYTAHYTLETETAANFSDPNNGQVTFKAGEGTTIVTLKVSNMKKGATYAATVSLSAEDQAKADTITASANFQTAISVMCDYEWEEAGTATFIDNIFGEEIGIEGLSVMHAKTTEFNLYKLVAPYQTIYGSDSFKKADIKFYLNDDFSAKSLEKGITDMFSGTSYQAYYNPDDTSYGDYCSFANTGSLFSASVLIVQNGSIIDVGNFQFIWNEWPGEK